MKDDIKNCKDKADSVVMALTELMTAFDEAHARDVEMRGGPYEDITPGYAFIEDIEKYKRISCLLEKHMTNKE